MTFLNRLGLREKARNRKSWCYAARGRPDLVRLDWETAPVEPMGVISRPRRWLSSAPLRTIWSYYLSHDWGGRIGRPTSFHRHREGLRFFWGWTGL